MAYILSIDQSTSATKAVLFDDQAKLKSRMDLPHQQFYPKAGWVEHDPIEIYNNTVKLIGRLTKEFNIGAKDLQCISIANQRETVVAWDKNTEQPLCNAVVWQCLRGEEQCHQLQQQGYAETFRQKTGLLLDPYFSASGLSWILNHYLSAGGGVRYDNVLAGTIDTWLLWKLTNGKVHATDYTNACRSLLFNIHTLSWDEELCSLFGIPMEILPEVMESDHVFGIYQCSG